jgi:hypothetical protein
MAAKFSNRMERVLNVVEFLRDDDEDEDSYNTSEEFVMDVEEAREFMEEFPSGVDLPRDESPGGPPTEDDSAGEGHVYTEGELEFPKDDYDSDAEPAYIGFPSRHKKFVTAIEYLIESSYFLPKVWNKLGPCGNCKPGDDDHDDSDSDHDPMTGIEFLIETSIRPPRALKKRASAPNIIQYSLASTVDGEATGGDEAGGDVPGQRKLIKQRSAPLIKRPTLSDLSNLDGEPSKEWKVEKSEVEEALPREIVGWETTV